MDLDLAQRISLIQRNLQSAQLMIDNAVELLNLVIAGSMGSVTMDAPMSMPTGFKKLGRPRKTQEDTQAEPAKAKVKQPVMTQRDIVREYLKANTGPFNAIDAVKWARQHGHSVKTDAFRATVHSMAGEKKEIISNGKGTYQRVA